MLKRVLQSTVVAGLICAVPLAAAHASEVCTTGSLAVCVTFTLTNTGTDTYSLRVDFTSSNDGGSLYQIGILDGSTNPFAINGTGDVQTGTIGGSASNNLNWDFGCSGLPGLNLCAEGPTGGGAVQPGQFVLFDFTTNAPLPADFSGVEEQAHIQAFPNLPDCSVKVSTASGTFSSPGTPGGSFNADAASCDLTPTTSTPEPASLWLMGTGLIGLAGGGFAKRRRKK